MTTPLLKVLYHSWDGTCLDLSVHQIWSFYIYLSISFIPVPDLRKEFKIQLLVPARWTLTTPFFAVFSHAWDGICQGLSVYRIQWCAKYYFQNNILFLKYKIVFYFVFSKYFFQVFCYFQNTFFENTFCKGQTKGKLISDRDHQLLMSLSSEIRSFQLLLLLLNEYY